MRILVSGSSGFVGSALIPRLEREGHEIVRLVRARPGRRSGAGSPASEIVWDPQEGPRASGDLNGIDAAVHLAGENLAAGRWTPARKARIRDSRERGTRRLARALAAATPRPSVLLSSSAVGYYGDRGSERLDEESTAGTGFLAEVCRTWEEAAAPAREAGIRVVNLRFGLILGPRGGALARMLTPFRLGLGGRLGHGRQYMSWVALEDAIAACRHALTTTAIEGPINVVAPGAVTNREFTSTLARVLARPAVLPAPGFALRAAFGEMADEALLASQRVDSRRLRESGFEFRFPELEPALRHAVAPTGTATGS